MKKPMGLFLLCVFSLAACSGVNSVVKKKWKNEENTISVIDITSKDDNLMEAGARLHRMLEESLTGANFVITSSSDPARYQLKYKVVEYEPGNRVARFAALGVISKAGKAEIRVQAALFTGSTLLGRWDVEGWVNDGFLGGTDKTMFKEAARKIVEHLKGDY
jgi:hypothetical protein